MRKRKATNKLHIQNNNRKLKNGLLKTTQGSTHTQYRDHFIVNQSTNWNFFFFFLMLFILLL